MIGIVIVSHSHALAEAAVALAAEMVPPDARPAVVTAAGLDEATFGTDAAAIADAIGSADSGDGVLVLLDLGSAILSAELALEFCDPDVAARVRLSPAPLVEGLVAAVVTAATGAGLDACDAEARRGLDAKAAHLGDGAGSGGASGDGVLGDGAVGDGASTAAPSGPGRSFVVDLPHGLHARPAAALVAALTGLDAAVTARNATAGSETVDARSVAGLSGLGLRFGDVLQVWADGPDADAALDALAALVKARFGELSVQPEAPDVSSEGGPEPGVTAGPNPAASGPVRGLAHVLAGWDATASAPGPDEAGRLAAAQDAVRAHLEGLASGAHAEILRAQVALVADRYLLAPAHEAIGAGSSAGEAVGLAIARASGRLDRLPDPYLRARGEDVRGLGRLLAAALAGADLSDRPPEGPYVLVAAELDAATAVALDPARCHGVLTWAGSDVGHGAIIAAASGIPLLTGVDAARHIAEGQPVAFDPETKRLLPAS